MGRAWNVVLSVRGRITLAATGLVALTLTLASVVLIDLVQADLLASTEESLTAALDAESRQIERADVIPRSIIERAERGFGFGASGEVEVQVFTLRSDGLAHGTLSVPGVPPVELAIDPGTATVEGFTAPPGPELPVDDAVRSRLDALALDVRTLDGPADDRLLVAAVSLAEVRQSVEALRRSLVLLVPFLVLLFGAATWWLLGRALRPVVSITDQVDAISSTSLDRRVPVPDTGDEVAELATVMNRMLDRLETGGERQRQFAADASHELRSPLTTIRAAAEMLAQRPDAGRTVALAGDIEAEAVRMGELIADLLELARLDESGHSPPGDPIDLAGLIRAELASRPRPPDLDVELVAPPRAMVRGSASQLRRLVRNLVENAERHATGRVVVTLSSHGTGGAADTTDGSTVLTVDDDGTGIPDADKERVFERFSRLDEARSRDAGGSGLGLALVRAVADHHGGRAVVTDAGLGGARVRVTLPSAETPVTPPTDTASPVVAGP